MRYFLLLILILGVSFLGNSQMGIITGKVVDKTNKGFLNVVVYVESNPTERTRTNLDGYFELETPIGEQTVIVRYNDEIKELYATVYADEMTSLGKIKLKIQVFDEVNVTGQGRDLSVDRLPKIEVAQIPGPSSGVEKYITLTTAATSNNELTNNYNVRGGSYDENLIYVNGFLINRPFLTRTGEQEGMSFINPNLIESISFSAGGFAARYGDRLSSVLDIQYKDPEKFGGSFDASFLGVGAHIEDKVNPRLNYMVATRYQDKGYLLKALPATGAYKPRFFDFQFLTNYAIKENLIWSVLGHYSLNQYMFAPVSQETKFGTIDMPLAFKVYFEGQEVTKFQTITGATSLKWKVNKRTDLDFYASIFNSDERETFDILGEYFINQVGNDPAKEEFGDSVGTIGVGAYLDHARNQLKAMVYSFRHEGKHDFLKISKDGLSYKNQGQLRWGASGQYEDFYDVLSEWHLIDSTGYSLPQSNGDEVELSEVIKANNTLTSFRTAGFAQFSQSFDKFKTVYPIKIKVRSRDASGKKRKTYYYDTIQNSRSQFTYNIGVRTGYTAFNNEFYATPRAMVNYFPRQYFLDKDSTLRKRYIRLHASAGMYYQPPFYRELRRFDGTLNVNTKSQKSVHVVAGIDYAFNMWDRITPFKLSAELFYKYMWDVNPYYIDNVRMRYLATNNAIGHAYGLDLQLNGEFIDGVQSFFKIGLLRSVEDLMDDDYYTYINSEGEEIIPGYTFNNVPVDSIHHSPGFIPKPTDQWFTFATLLQDRMPKLGQMTVQLGLNFGTRLPYGPPGYERYKDTLRQKPYFRVDLGLGYDFLFDKPKESRKKIFRPFTDIRLNFEVFNLLGINNVLSYQWIRETQGRFIAIPNYLTQRRFSLKLVVRW